MAYLLLGLIVPIRTSAQWDALTPKVAPTEAFVADLCELLSVDSVQLK